MLQAQQEMNVGQEESKHNGKHNDQQLSVVNIITIPDMSGLLHIIFYANGTFKNREWTINKTMFLCNNRKANKI